MIETLGLRKQFGAKTAVDGLNLVIPQGRVTGLLGLNGAGKTTTIKILATLLRQTSGTVRIGGLDPVKQPHAVRRRINLIAGGERMVYARLTGRENLWYFGQLYDIPGKVLRPRIEELLELVGLTEAAGTRVEQYSRGMTQRLSIARGLINDPDYLLLDEPTLGLDAPIARDLRKVVAELARHGKGVLLTSHYLAEVEQLCEHVYVIGDGRHLAEGTPAQLMAQTGCHRTVRVTVSGLTPEVEAAALAFDPAVRIISQDVREGGVVELSRPGDVAGALTMAIVGAGGTLSGLEIAEPSLEDAILALNDRRAVAMTAGAGRQVAR
ncbi:ABC transporter ATP-binding protein [Nonomuraea rubra]|uniref:ABC-2 type transport system ATP-binding protein n=1 Tax=Nonomuraea rubra TaxID=46180 RepID=A0A7X0U4Q4_9ACTN|nr:ABC transporter ATP-binding protein [Nonomuraea rubra]MBB6555013.1 ABC-2 type transport system ATP-binding protein [Nonomuraea rubra]